MEAGNTFNELGGGVSVELITGVEARTQGQSWQGAELSGRVEGYGGREDEGKGVVDNIRKMEKIHERV